MTSVTEPRPATAGTAAVASLVDLDARDVDRAGTEGAALGWLLRAGLPVPGGFVVLAGGLHASLVAAGLDRDVTLLHGQALGAVRAQAAPWLGDRLAAACARLQDLVRRAGTAPGLADAVAAAYAALGDDVPVTVRSSAVGEDGGEQASAGAGAGPSAVRGAAAVVSAVVESWASLFGPRPVAARARCGIDGVPAPAVVVQRTVPARRSGVACTADPLSGRRDRVVVEAARVPGGAAGGAGPDTYVLDAEGRRLLGVQHGGHGSGPAPRGAQPVLTPAEAQEVAALALRVHRLTGMPQRVEWAADDEGPWLLRTRPAGHGPPPAPAAAPAGEGATEPTATGLTVVLDDPGRAGEVAALPVDGVGLLRAEPLLVRALGGTHPAEALARGRPEEVVDALADGIGRVARALAPRPVLYRTADLRSDELRRLAGGEAHEPVEANPLLGLRGCARYLADPALFRLELAALARVHEECPRLGLLLPIVRTGAELERTLALVDASPLGRRHGMARWVTAAVPSAVHWLPAYVAMGIGGVAVDGDGLTRLVLGDDRDPAGVADPAVLAAVAEVAGTAHRLGIPSSFCGRDPTEHPGLLDSLVRAGVTSVAVAPAAVAATRRGLARAERRVLLEAALAPRDGEPR
ncbi:PEP/pyruvate-binding domain-containing protein [Geodermatophilus sp. SYSU D01036]